MAEIKVYVETCCHFFKIYVNADLKGQFKYRLFAILTLALPS